MTHLFVFDGVFLKVVVYTWKNMSVNQMIYPTITKH